MANVKVAINGFGRIGRLAFRQMFGAEGYEVVAINDLTSPTMLAHLLKYDSAQGRYALADTVSANDEAGTITVDGKTIKIYAEKDAVNCPWGALDVDVVLECTGFYWFGKRRNYGDTFPHPASVHTANAFLHYAQITSAPEYRERAYRSARNLLSLFNPDGSASNCYVYPFSVNGIECEYYDEFANDQDGALYYLIKFFKLHKEI